MKKILLVIAAVSLSACATVQPYKATATSTKDTTEVFNCALGVATSLDYTPEQVSKESGFFKAEHNFRAGAKSINWGAGMTDAIAVLVTKQADGTTLQVTGSSGKNAGRNLRLIESSSGVVAAANKIVSTCK